MSDKLETNEAVCKEAGHKPNCPAVHNLNSLCPEECMLCSTQFGSSTANMSLTCFMLAAHVTYQLDAHLTDCF